MPRFTEVMISETESIVRPMTPEEELVAEYFEGPQWTPLQIAEMRHSSPPLRINRIQAGSGR